MSSESALVVERFFHTMQNRPKPPTPSQQRLELAVRRRALMQQLERDAERWAWERALDD